MSGRSPIRHPINITGISFTTHNDHPADCTPGPWVANGRNIEFHYPVGRQGRDECEIVAKICDDNIESAANARHIVHCVNSHATMLKALKTAERHLAAADICGMSCGIELAQVRAAIAEAEGDDA